MPHLMNTITEDLRGELKEGYPTVGSPCTVGSGRISEEN